ncbi:MAG TPA: DNA mismatch repair endonuclease MutL [Clostridiales bacterium]|nr:DNA mismatch repair endonuclease MutL [Clostridiales bacterium]
MSKINVLPKNIAELIAAGEVVERPASVVKETLENSIDAGATSITVEIKNGGITYIRITDDGSGIEKEDIEKAFLSHATSKISTADDLNAIFTLGFRGEALASIAAVSKVEVLSRVEGEDIGSHLIIEGGEKVMHDDAGCPVGTTLIVRDIFYNVPARMKFLKRDVTEANYIADIVDKVALSHPEISFRFIRDGKQELLTPGDGNLYNTVYALFGKEFASGLLEAKYSNDGFEIDGFVSKPEKSRPNRNMQFFFLNGRYIKSATASAALSEAYKNSVMAGKFPSCVLNIKINPEHVDVNVHPTKTEVRFSNEKSLFSTVYYCAKNAITNYFLHPEESLNLSPVGQIKASQTDDKESKTGQNATEKNVTRPTERKWELNKVKTAVDSSLLRKLNIVADDLDVKQKSLFANLDETEEKESVSVFPENEKTEAVEVTSVSAVKSSFPQEAEREYKPSVKDELPGLDVIGEVFATYIIAQLGEKVFLIDKHAAHERIIFDKLNRQQDDGDRQILLTPLTVLLNKEEYAAVLDNLDLLAESGFDVSDFGGGTVIVRECPMELQRHEIEDVIFELAGFLLTNTNELLSSKKEWLLQSIACRAAIKAGDFTSAYERERFVTMLLKNPDVRFCPHGRPVYIEVKKSEFEKLFKRS